MLLAVRGNTIPAAPAAPSLFHRGRTFPVPEGTAAVSYQALHGSWIAAMWIHTDPRFSLPLTPLLALWVLQGDTFAPTARDTGVGSREG